MPRLFALADLHLSLGGDKPMDVFGDQWRDHHLRMAEAWDARIAPEDHVLLPGDLSWGRNLEEARPDLEWIGERPGRKWLLRGNHDSWWSSVSRVRTALPDGCRPLQNEAVAIGRWTLLGARGWTAPDDPRATPRDEAIYNRELGRLELSIAAADRLDAGKGRRVAMLHFPPGVAGGGVTPVIERLQRARVEICVYGHLHGDDHRWALRGEQHGVRFHFVAADAVGFAPEEIPLELD